MIGRRPYTRTVVWTASKDLVHEPLMTICSVMALSAVLAPLLVLLSLKFGLVDTLADRLIEDVRNREITTLRSANLTPEWFEDLAAQDEVEFVIPLTRTLAASFNTLQNRSARATLRGAMMIPTQTGDPLLSTIEQFPSEPTEIVLSELAAERLQAGLGSILRARVQRTRNNTAEAVFLDLEVVAVAPDWASTEPVVFVTPALLNATEDYREGRSAPEFGWPGETLPAEARTYPRFRLYARSIYDVPNVRDRLVAEGLDIRTQAAAIEAMTALDRNLSIVFGIVAGVGISGFVAAFGASLAANVQRKRAILSLLRLVGTPAASVVMFPLTQAILIAIISLFLCAGLFSFASQVLNDVFSSSLRADEFVSRLTAAHGLIAVVATLGLATFAALWGGFATTRIDPAEGLTDV